MTTSEIQQQVHELRDTYASGRTHHYKWRMEQLRALRALLVEREDDLVKALHADSCKPEMEAFGAEVAMVRADIDYNLKNLRKWMRPKSVSTPLVMQPGSSKIYYEPLGVVLIIGAWNYPVQLILNPLVGAIAAGNCAVMKPSEISAHASEAMAKFVPQYLDPKAFRVVEGGVPETEALLSEKFDHILYTGGGSVARVIMTAAAKHLTPVTLELGGKSPCIVDKDVDLAVTARRLVWAKFYNCGQTCTAPDYVLAHREIEEPLIRKIEETIQSFYGTDPSQSADYGRIINSRHFDRVKKLMDGEDVAIGGKTDAESRYIEPTVLRGVSPDAHCMQEEIFGPVLPILTVDHLDDAVRFVNERPKPLALYIFTRDRHRERHVLERTSSGGVCVNHAVMHAANPELPFGGVGPSGTGAYHGRAGFETFSHRKAVLRKPFALDSSIAYPPYTDGKIKLLKKVM